ncbi:MAG: hypothetical protein ABW049_02775, partial [Spongiibacteraceae bacterium]
TGIAHTDVLVAKARSNDGIDLDLVLYPATASGAQSLTIERLHRDRRYRVSSKEQTQEIVADAQGRAMFSVNLDGRTSVRIEPS